MKWLLIACLGLIAVAVLWMVLPVKEWLEIAINRIDQLGPWGLIIYFILYFCLACVTFPSTPLNIGAGLVFRFWMGAIIALAAGSLASMTTFVFARYVGKDWASRRLESMPNCQAVLEAVEEEGFKMVLLARLNPFIPASMKNFGFGLTAIPYWKYATATVLGQCPIVLAYVYLGWAGSAALLHGDEKPSAFQYTWIVVGVVVSVALLLAISWYGSKKLKDDE